MKTLLPVPEEPLSKEQQGPAHALLARANGVARSVPAEAVRFEAPLRTNRGTVARGGELLNRGTLWRILSWARPTQRPDLAVILVDADGKSDRRSPLLQHTQDLPGVRVIAVAVQEFEAWLLGDEAALRAVFARDISSTISPEKRVAGDAKKYLNDL